MRLLLQLLRRVGSWLILRRRGRSRFPFAMLLSSSSRLGRTPSSSARHHPLHLDLRVLSSILRRPNGETFRTPSSSRPSSPSRILPCQTRPLLGRRRNRGSSGGGGSIEVRVWPPSWRRPLPSRCLCLLRSSDFCVFPFLGLPAVRLLCSRQIGSILLPLLFLFFLLPVGLLLFLHTRRSVLRSVDDGEVPEHEIRDEDLFVERSTRVGELDVGESVNRALDVDRVASKVGEGARGRGGGWTGAKVVLDGRLGGLAEKSGSDETALVRRDLRGLVVLVLLFRAEERAEDRRRLFLIRARFGLGSSGEEDKSVAIAGIWKGHREGTS
jgi:hypothetical protein